MYESVVVSITLEIALTATEAPIAAAPIPIFTLSNLLSELALRVTSPEFSLLVLSI